MRIPFKYGIVSDASRVGYAKVYFQEDDIVTDWWPVLQQTSLKDKRSWPLNVQEHVVCLCDQSMEEGVIIGSIYNDLDLPPRGGNNMNFYMEFEDGTIIQYDKGNHMLTANVKGSVKVDADGDISVMAGKNLVGQAGIKVTINCPEIEITGNVLIAGNLSFSGTLAGGGGSLEYDGTTLNVPGLNALNDVQAGSINLKTHIHAGVQTGVGSSGPPL